jgi:hypothetical protein
MSTTIEEDEDGSDVAATLFRSMARHHVRLRIACPARPTRDDLAFLGPLKATASTRGNELTVSLDVDAPDVVDALAQARDTVVGRIPGEIQFAEVVPTDGMLLPPGRLFGRRRF